MDHGYARLPPADAPHTIGDVLRIVGSPLVELAADEPLGAIARLMTFTGLDAVLLVRPCGAAERIVSTRDIVKLVSGTSLLDRDECRIDRCSPDDPFVPVVTAMFDRERSAVLVECGGRRLALITVDSVAGYLAACRAL